MTKNKLIINGDYSLEISYMVDEKTSTVYLVYHSTLPLELFDRVDGKRISTQKEPNSLKGSMEKEMIAISSLYEFEERATLIKETFLNTVSSLNDLATTLKILTNKIENFLETL